MKFIGLLIVFLLGLSIVHATSKKISIKEMIGFAFPIGFGAITVIIFLINLFYIPIRPFPVMFGSFLAILALNIPYILDPQKIIQNIKNIKRPKTGQFNLVWFAALLIIIYLTGSMAAKCLYWPTISWDAMTSFDFFAKSIAHEGKIINSMVIHNIPGPGLAYPPLFSFSLAYAYIIGFSTPKIVVALIFLSLYFAFYNLLRKYASPTNAILMTLLLIMTPEMLAHGAILQTNLTFAFFGGMGIITLDLYLINKQRYYFILSAILMGFAGWIRGEGLGFSGVALFILFIHHIKNKQFKDLLYYGLIALSLWVIWIIYLNAHPELKEFAKTSLITSLFWDPHRYTLITQFTKAHAFNTNMYGITFYTFLIVLLLNIRNIIIKKDRRYFLALFILAWLAYLVMLYQFNYGNMESYDRMIRVLKHSYKRFLFVYVMLAWFYIGSNQIVRSLFERLDRYLDYPKKTI